MTIGPGMLKNTRGWFRGTINPFLKFFKLKDGSETKEGLILVH